MLYPAQMLVDLILDNDNFYQFLPISVIRETQNKQIIPDAYRF